MAATEMMKIPCKIAELSLDISLNCGQSFRSGKEKVAFCYSATEFIKNCLKITGGKNL